MNFVESATKISLGKKKRVIPRFWRNSKNKMLVHSRKMPEKQTILTVFRDGEIFKSIIRKNVLRDVPVGEKLTAEGGQWSKETRYLGKKNQKSKK